MQVSFQGTSPLRAVLYCKLEMSLRLCVVFENKHISSPPIIFLIASFSNDLAMHAIFKTKSR